MAGTKRFALFVEVLYLVSMASCAKLVFSILVFISSGCVTAEIGRPISPQDMAWIQKGKTTRVEVIQRFWAPESETPDWAAMQYQVNTTTTTTRTTRTNNEESQQSVTTTTVEPIKPRTKALYLYKKVEGGLFVGVQTTEEQFWVTYDENGVVQDLGLQAGPGMRVH